MPRECEKKERWMRRALAVWRLWRARRMRMRGEDEKGGSTLVARRSMEGESDDDEDVEDSERRTESEKLTGLVLSGLMTDNSRKTQKTR